MERLQERGRENDKMEEKEHIFPYWKTLLLRHNLDVMHFEKNIFVKLVL